ncbi:MAG: hypothetical protein JNL11_19870 [Bdellovibrionaceae bacterium]|nr:hypothetical protein [Pseudobdellovibrionaceae bacterium]
MKTTTPKSIRTLASDLKARRKRKLTDSEINKLNEMFEQIEKEQSKENEKRKIARQPEV